MTKTLQTYGALLDKEIAYYEKKMYKSNFLRRKKDKDLSDEQIKYILVGLKQAKEILIGYVMLPEDLYEK